MTISDTNKYLVRFLKDDQVIKEEEMTMYRIQKILETGLT